MKVDFKNIAVRLDEYLRPFNWLYFLGLGFLYGTELYFFGVRSTALPQFIASNTLGASVPFYLAVVLVSTLLTLVLAKAYKRLSGSSFLPILLVALLAIGYRLSGGPHGVYLQVIFYSASAAIFLGSTVLDPLVKFIEKRKDLIYVVALIFAALFALYSIMRHVKFESHAYDLGLYINAFYHYAHLDFSNSIKAITNLMGDHFHPILILLSMTYWLLPLPVIPLIVQAIIVAAGGIPLYFLARDLLKSKTTALFIVLAYYFYIGLQMAIDFDFHTATLAPAFYFLTFYFVYKKRWGAYLLSLIPLLAIKENISMHVVFLGIYQLFSRKTYKYGLLTILIGGIWFVAVTQYIMPAVSTYGFNYFEYSRSLGPTPLAAVISIVTNPLHALHALYDNPLKVTTIWNLFTTFGFVCLFAPGILFLGIPMVGEGLWNDQAARWFGFHYTYPPAPVFALAAAFGLYNLVKVLGRENDVVFKARLALYIFLCSFLVATYFDMPLLRLVKPSFYRLSEQVKDTYEATKVIPKNASVFAQDSVIPHFANREKAYNFPFNKTPERMQSDYLVFSLGLSSYPFTTDADFAKEIKNYMSSTRWGIYKRVNGAMVFKYDYKPTAEEYQATLDYLDQYLKQKSN